MFDAELMGLIATSYGVGAAGTVLLQARQIVRRGSSCDVSARFFATYAGGYAIWLLYGISIGSAPVILVHAVGLLAGSATLVVTLRMRGSLLRPSAWADCPGRSAPVSAAAAAAGEP